MRLGLAGQHRRQQHAIIGEPRLVADDRNGVTAERDFCQLIDEPGSGHAVADHDQGFAHCQIRASARFGAPAAAGLRRR